MARSKRFSSRTFFIHHAARRGAVMGADVFFVCFSYSLAYFIRFYYAPFAKAFPVDKGIPLYQDYVKAAPIVLLIWAAALATQKCYRRLNISAVDEAVRLFNGSVVGTILSMSAMFLYRDSSFSRLVFVMGGLASGISLYIFRELAKLSYLFWIRKNHRPLRVLIIGEGYLSNTLQKIMDRHGDRAVLKRSPRDLADIRRTIVRSRIDEVLIANPQMRHDRAIQVANFCDERGVVFRLFPDILEMRMGEVLIDEYLGIPTIRLKSLSLHGSAFLTKRIMDVVLSSLIIGCFFGPFFLISFLIKITSDGPVFYRQPRMGLRERTFEFLKFRTMVDRAEGLLDALKSRSDRPGPVFKMKDDPRTTLVGRILRRYSLDEFPQLLNVLRGEMSLVGPRPQVLWEAQAYDDWARKRLNVLPGMTGLWQVRGRAELTYEEMIELDIYYIENWSPGLDMKILVQTIPAVLLGKGAY